MYSIFLSNADFECIERVYSHRDRDIVETKAVKLFKESGCRRDFIVLDSEYHLVSHVLTIETIRIRGECQG